MALGQRISVDFIFHFVQSASFCHREHGLYVVWRLEERRIFAKKLF